MIHALGRSTAVQPRFSKPHDAIEAIARGEIVIVVDAESRENEGDFICAAEKVTPELVNFMLTHGRGQVCAPILAADAARLKLEMMVSSNTSPTGTAFTIPVDHLTCLTGITAVEKARTIRALCDQESRPADFVRPGHMFPLIAREGGVLERPGHTEASVDLSRLAGLHPAGVLCEILRPDGERASRDDLTQVARDHGLHYISIEQLIELRRSA